MTTLGKHTINELKELLEQKDFQIAQIQKAADAFDTKWAASRDPARDAWKNDWRALLVRYFAAKAKAQGAIQSNASSMFALGPDTATAEDEYVGILVSLTTGYPGAYTDTDYQGLYNRFAIAQKKQVSFVNAPPLTAKDGDLAAYKAVDDGIKQGEKAAKDFALSTPVMLGGLALGLIGVIAIRR